MTVQRLTMVIDGLTCGGGGALTVERALAKTPGVLRVYVNPLTEMAYVEYDPARTDAVQLAGVVQRAGFRAGEPSLR